MAVEDSTRDYKSSSKGWRETHRASIILVDQTTQFTNSVSAHFEPEGDHQREGATDNFGSRIPESFPVIFQCRSGRKREAKIHL